MAQENDIVLIHYEEKPLTFARIEEISPDNRKDWYHVKLLMLQIPLQVVTWILKDVYIDGETFTMNEREIRLEKVECPETPEDDGIDDDINSDDSKDAKVISLSDHKK